METTAALCLTGSCFRSCTPVAYSGRHLPIQPTPFDQPCCAAARPNLRKKKDTKGSIAWRYGDLITCLAPPPLTGGRSLPASILLWSTRDQTTSTEHDISDSGESDDKRDGDSTCTGYEARQNTVKTGPGPGERPPYEGQRIRARGTCLAW